MARLYQQTPSMLCTQASSGLADLQAASVGTKASRKARSFTSYNTNRLTPGGADSFNNRREMRNTFRKQCTTTAKKKQHVAPSGDKEPNYNTHTPGHERRHRPPSGARDKQLHNPTIEDLSRNPLTSHLVNCINFDNTFHGERKKKRHTHDGGWTAEVAVG